MAGDLEKCSAVCNRSQQALKSTDVADDSDLNTLKKHFAKSE